MIVFYDFHGFRVLGLEYGVLAFVALWLWWLMTLVALYPDNPKALAFSLVSDDEGGGAAANPRSPTGRAGFVHTEFRLCDNPRRFRWIPSYWISVPS